MGGREGRRLNGGVGSLVVDRRGEEGLRWRDAEEGRGGRGEEGVVVVVVGVGREEGVGGWEGAGRGLKERRGEERRPGAIHFGRSVAARVFLERKPM